MIKTRIRKRRHRLDGIRVEGIKMFSFSSNSAYKSIASDPVRKLPPISNGVYISGGGGGGGINIRKGFQEGV